MLTNYADVKNETNKDGSGKGQWSAWKASKLSKEYEKKGGDYENEAGSKNEATKGTPKAKTSAKKEKELKDSKEEETPSKKEETTEKSDKENVKPSEKEKKAPAKASILVNPLVIGERWTNR
jgi:hypothetical protein